MIAFLGIAASLPAFLTVLASAAKNQSKVALLNQLDEFIRLRKRNFKLKEESPINETKLLLTFIIVNVFSFVGCVINAFFNVPDLFGLYLQYEIFTTTLNVQSFQILAYANAIVNELNALSRIDLNKLNRRGLKKFKANLVNVRGVVEDISNCFQLPILCITFWNFFSVLEDTTLIVIFFLGNFPAGLIGMLKF